MSILIKGMEMPTEQYGKMVITLYPNGHVAEYVGDIGRVWDAVPVPPHGDLIDRKELYEKTAEWEAQALHMCEVTMNDENPSEWRRWSAVLTERSAFKYDVANAPTIIPAEEGE